MVSWTAYDVDSGDLWTNRYVERPQLVLGTTTLLSVRAERNLLQGTKH